MRELQAGDLLHLVPEGEPWRIRQVLPRRLRISGHALLNNPALQQRLLNASLHLAWVQAIRINTLAGCLVIEHNGPRPLRRKQLQALLHLALARTPDITAAHTTGLELRPMAARWHLRCVDRCGAAGVTSLAGPTAIYQPLLPASSGPLPATARPAAVGDWMVGSVLVFKPVGPRQPRCGAAGVDAGNRQPGVQSVDTITRLRRCL